MNPFKPVSCACLKGVGMIMGDEGLMLSVSYVVVIMCPSSFMTQNFISIVAVIRSLSYLSCLRCF